MQTIEVQGKLHVAFIFQLSYASSVSQDGSINEPGKVANPHVKGTLLPVQSTCYNDEINIDQLRGNLVF